VGGIPATRQVDLDNPSPPSPLLLSATAWFYTPDSTPIAMKVNRVDPLFGNQTIATKVSSSAGWQSVSVPISEGFFPPHQISLDSANLGFSASGLSNGIRRVYAAFIQINTEP
jgi:hypothetical protein